MQKIRKQANVIANAEETTRGIAKLLKKEKLKFREQREVVVSKSFTRTPGKVKGKKDKIVDARMKKVSAKDVYKIVEDYAKSAAIDLFVLEVHGSENSIESGKHSMPMHASRIEKITNTVSEITTVFSDNRIKTTEFLKGLSAATGGKPISVLLTACKGQLAVDGFNKNLPAGSEILTLGEYQELLGTHQDLNTVDVNMQRYIKIQQK